MTLSKSIMIRQKIYQLVVEKYGSGCVGSEHAQSQEIKPPVSCVSNSKLLYPAFSALENSSC